MTYLWYESGQISMIDWNSDVRRAVSYRSVLVLESKSERGMHTTTYDLAQTHDHLLLFQPHEIFKSVDTIWRIIRMVAFATVLFGSMLLFACLWIFGTATQRLPEGFEWLIFLGLAYAPPLFATLYMFWKDPRPSNSELESALHDLMLAKARDDRDPQASEKPKLQLVLVDDWHKFTRELQSARP